MKYAIGIDIGGTNTRVALINENYEIVKKEQFRTDVHHPENVMQNIKELILSFHVTIEGIGISCPGPLDLVNQVVLTPPNLPGWHYFEIAKVLSDITGYHVQLENDANLACLAEAALGAGKDAEVVQFLTISTGVGAGLSIHKKLYHGAKGFAQEVANCIVWKDGPQQSDLVPGSIESVASGTAITKRAIDAGLHVQHAGDVHALASQGNETALAIMEDAYEYLSNFIAMLYGVLDPDVFVLSGSVALKINGFIERIETLVKQKVYSALQDHIHIVKAELDEDCGLIGAAYVIFHA